MPRKHCRRDPDNLGEHRSRRPGPGETRRPIPPHRHAAPAFRCSHCRAMVASRAPGTRHRNHCPTCLWSAHLDRTPGDRAADCGAGMEPLAVCVRGAGEWVLVHRCTGCGELDLNRTAGDDNPLILFRLAVRPLAAPPFPLEMLLE